MAKYFKSSDQFLKEIIEKGGKITEKVQINNNYIIWFIYNGIEFKLNLNLNSITVHNLSKIYSFTNDTETGYLNAWYNIDTIIDKIKHGRKHKN